MALVPVGSAKHVRRVRNVLVVLVAVVAGVVYPAGAQYVQPVTELIVILLLYSSLRGVEITRERFAASLGSVGVVLVLSYLLIPAVGIGWSRLYLADGSLLGVAIILSAPATAGSSIVWTRLGRGNEELSGMASLASIAFAPLLTPVVLFLLVGHIHSLPVVDLGSKLLVIIAAAITLRYFVPLDAVDDRTVEYGSIASIMLLIYAGVGRTGLENTTALFVGQIGSLVLVVFVVGFLAVLLLHVASDRSREDLLSLFFTGTLKNLGISLFVVLSYGSTIAIQAIIVYYVSQQLVSALFVDGLADRLAFFG